MVLSDFACFIESILREVFAALETFLARFGLDVVLEVPDLGCDIDDVE
jgi:hypothetical protein